MSQAATVSIGGARSPESHSPRRVALVGNPNTGKTSVFNRLTGLRHKTSNFPGTTQECRVGFMLDTRGGTIEVLDLPGVYSLELAQGESEVCRGALAGMLAPAGAPARAPDAVIVVIDATNLARNLLLAGEALRRRLPTLIVVNMIDIARKRGVHIDAGALGEGLGCEVLLVSARTGQGIDDIAGALERAVVPNRTPPGDQGEIERWAEGLAANATARTTETEQDRADRRARTDRMDHAFTHPVLGALAFLAVMAGLFWGIFSLATYPMAWIEWIFAELGGLVQRVLPAGILSDFLSQGVVVGIGATVVFLPQICLLFFVISLLEDTGYLARAAFVMDRLLRPFGLPGHSFVPLLSSHACALPGIMACRAIPDRRERLATILVAPFMTCSARIPVYALMTGILFPGSPGRQAAAFIGCYALGIVAGVLSALVARRTILKGASRPMALELPAYRWPNLRSALITSYDRGRSFIANAGTNILLICIVLWWLGAFPHVKPPARVEELREVAAQVEAGSVEPKVALERAGVENKVEVVGTDGTPGPRDREDAREIDGPAAASMIVERADELEAMDAKSRSFIGRLGRLAEPVFRPIGYDWQLSIGVLSSFAAREVFVSTMAVVVTGHDTTDDEKILSAVSHASRTNGTPIFTKPVAWSILVFYVLAMQCLPTLALTAREAGGVRWAVLQFAWMSLLAYLGAWIAYTIAS
ncbi:MAG: ferrous iron transporter B [Phycisphaerales bacterium]|nr:MAG: ferrous iron transporter B [Phycisphaerales bacterium]